jgi:hypothetical protein
MAEKDLVVNAIGLVDVNGSTNIPTVLFYQKEGAPAIGSDALALAPARRHINEDFKVDLGNLKPGSSTPRRLYTTAAGGKKSAAELTGDFVHTLLTYVSDWLSNRDLKRAPSIMVAEPLSMLTESSPHAAQSREAADVRQGELVSRDWLQNYRKNLKVILLGKGFEEDRIKFLPEPFAVFQYYRHGYRHPLVADKRKHNALVLDFGGGTFDVCIVETRNDGEIDINESGRLSKAQSAASRPIGGFYVNRAIAEAVLRKCLPKTLTTKFHTGLDIYRRWRRNESLAGISEEHKEFVRQFDSLCHEIEDTKLALSRSITDWRLNAPLSVSVPISIPENPFTATATRANCQLSAVEFREIFVDKIWRQQLKDVVRTVLELGREELAGAPITVVLLSGGSSNIKWIRELLKRDFQYELTSADVLEHRCRSLQAVSVCSAWQGGLQQAV